jgi:hypothetical protein
MFEQIIVYEHDRGGEIVYGVLNFRLCDIASYSKRSGWREDIVHLKLKHDSEIYKVKYEDLLKLIKQAE